MFLVMDRDDQKPGKYSYSVLHCGNSISGNSGMLIGRIDLHFVGVDRLIGSELIHNKHLHVK